LDLNLALTLDDVNIGTTGVMHDVGVSVEPEEMRNVAGYGRQLIMRQAGATTRVN
jgi:hypothetical protein